MNPSPNDNGTGSVLTPAQAIAKELDELRAEELQRQEQEQADDDARELEELRLVKRLSAEIGRRGVDFEVVNNPFGVFGIRKPDARGIKQLDLCIGAATPQNPVSIIRLIGILRNYIVPDDRALEFHRIAQERQGLVTGSNSVMAAVNQLTGVAKYEAKKKY